LVRSAQGDIHSTSSAIVAIPVFSTGGVALGLGQRDNRDEMISTRKLVAITAARHASERSAATVHLEMKRGLGVLKAIAMSAPLVGVLGTLFGIVTSFRGIAGERSADLGNLAEFLSEAVVSTGLGLLVAMLAYCGHEYLTAKLEGFGSEMRNASLQLINELTSARSI
jgi:biopolymer transport protein ExbB/TolQ